MKRFDDGTVAVNDLNFDIEEGEFLVLVGPSGCGKSTSLRMVAGLEAISGGEILIDGEAVNGLTPRERDIAMVFQTYALYPHMTVEQNMGFPLRMAGVSADEKAKRVRAAASVLDLEVLLNRYPRELSGGQRQRVAMGRAIVREPRVFLMDEPLSNLDAKLRVQMRGEIARLQRELGTTTLYVTHDQVEAMTLGDRVAVMHDGILQQLAPPGELYKSPETVFVAGFIGSPPMNLCRATIVEEGGGLAAKFGTFSLSVDPSSIEKYPLVRERIGKDVVLGTRPECFSIATEELPENKHIVAKVDMVEMLGAEALVYLPTDAEQIDSSMTFGNGAARKVASADVQHLSLVARIAPKTVPSHGETVSLGYEADSMHFFDIETGHALR
ncbi:sn-glycerol-3-phosphate ABC transporter ATP-binding protein UgpC [Histidinibacterium aquaticum]|uniref:sn-glycerol-3-phosphate ABC transporter ATP-binding protein UgpC n=2 Tax=Histidinibacterium aquaticum TaxID=2613962 RepID=A0A5J5GC77_9RHOB|nr:sn-glycerol-3-phosphate ABC transporter ATP-binding protein UgpC [Histidinibacterium aquaticum]